jgi:hypothetical protein
MQSERKDIKMAKIKKSIHKKEQEAEKAKTFGMLTTYKNLLEEILELKRQLKKLLIGGK